MALLFTSSIFPSVRAAIDTTLTAAMLPDLTIGLPIYHEAAEFDVFVKDPDMATRTGDDKKHIKNAVIFLTAARLIPALPQLIDGKVDRLEYELEPKDWQDLIAELRSKADTEIAQVIDASNTTPYRPTTMFTTAPGTRGF